MAFDVGQHYQSREAILLSALASCGEELTRLRTLGVWPLATEARATLVSHLREVATAIESYAEQLEQLYG